MKALVVEEAHVGEGHGDVVFVAGHDDMVVAHGAAGLGDVLHAALVGALDVVAKREEGVAAEAYAAVLGYPLALLLAGEGFGLVLEELLPGALAEHVVALVADVDIDGVVAVRRGGASPWGAAAATTCRLCCLPGGCNGCGSADRLRCRWPARP